MKRECMEELRGLINMIRSEGRDRRQAAAKVRWMLLSLMRDMPKLERAPVVARRHRWLPPGGSHRWN